jgi:hypothetical protein
MKYTKEYICSLKSSSNYAFECSECSKVFTRRASDVKRRVSNKDYVSTYCSQICSNKGNTTKQKCVCETCGIQFFKKLFETKRSKHHFCSSSCAAITTNKRRKKFRKCKLCSNELPVASKKYCSRKCHSRNDRLKKIALFKLGLVSSRPMLRKILGELYGEKCSMCGLVHWCNEATDWLTLPILLIVDHINGDSNNDSPDNLRLVCSNCDATLPTYKAKNKGNGRTCRKH